MREINLLALGKHDCGAFLNLEDYQINGVIDDTWKCPSCNRRVNYTHFGRPTPHSLYRTMVIGTSGEWTPMVPASDFGITIGSGNNKQDLLVHVPEGFALKVFQQA